MGQRVAATIVAIVGVLGVGTTLAQGPGVENFRAESLTLANALALVEARNRDFIVARRLVDAARADVLTAGARANPNLTVGLSSFNPGAGIGPGTIRDKSVDSFVRIDQLIERGAKRALRIDTAERVADAITADSGDVLRQQRLAATLAYYDLAAGQERTALANATIETYERTLAAAELRLRAGDIAQSDVTRLRVDALRAQSEARQAEADRRAAQLRLAYVTTLEAQAAQLRAVDPWPESDVARLATAEASEKIDDLIESRADVRAARARLEAAKSARELARRLRTRDVSVSAQYDRYPQNPGTTQGSGNSYGFAVSVPLFLRYHYEGEIARAEADLSTLTDSLDRVIAAARSELERARADRRATALRLSQIQGALLTEARRATDFAEFSFRNGASGVMDLLDARRVLRGVELEVLLARVDFARASAAYDAARDAGRAILASGVQR